MLMGRTTNTAALGEPAHRVALRTRSRRASAGGAAGSLLMHAAVAAALIARPVEPGYGNAANESVSQDTIETLVVDVAEESASTAPPAASAAQEAQTAVASAVQARAASASATESAPPPPSEGTELTGKTLPVDVEDGELEARKSEPARAPVEKRTEAAPAEVAAIEPKQPAPQPSNASADPAKTAQADSVSRAPQEERIASAAAPGIAAAGAAGGRVTASKGEIARYASAVRSRLARNKPSGVGARGTAVVAFEIAADGAVAGVRVAASSGFARLDTAALQAVHRSSPFPPPPDESAKSFQIPFTFQ